MTNLQRSIEATQGIFRRAFGYTPPQVVPVPEPIELLGNHAALAHGLVLTAAIDRHLVLAGAPRTDGQISLASPRGERVTFSRSQLDPQPGELWINTVRAMLAELRQRQLSFPGFDLAIGGSLAPTTAPPPIGPGLAGLGLFLHRLAPFPLATAPSAARPRPRRGTSFPALSQAEKSGLAQCCQQAGTRLTDRRCCTTELLTCLCAREFHALEIDTQSWSVAVYPLYGEVAWLRADTGLPADAANEPEKELNKLCASVAATLGTASLRRLDLKTLAGRRAMLAPRQYDALSHLLAETQRVIHAVRALQEGDLEQFGQYLFQSHESSRELLRNSTPELDLMVDLARAHPAALGARLTGPGWGGATLHMVRAHALTDYAEKFKISYAERLGYAPLVELLRTVPGAGESSEQSR